MSTILSNIALESHIQLFITLIGMTTRKIFISLIALICIIPMIAQQPIDSIAAQYKNQFAARPSELIYLQPSKGIYELGEDLWFKAYQLDAQTFGLSDKSKTLFLQMINPKDSVVWQEKYLIEKGIVSGHIYIDAKLAEGDYFLEAYTKHSFFKNDTTSITSSRKIKIVKNISRSAVIGNPKDSTIRFAMFPEGGNLVSGIPSKLAFKATDGKGNPRSVEGTLYQDDKPLSKIQSMHDGMGIIYFTPSHGKKYRIDLTAGTTYSLPQIYTEGMALRLFKQDKKFLKFIISKTEALPNQSIYLMGQMRGMVCCIAKGTLKDNLEISIPLENFSYQGIAEFTLFNASMQPIAERLVYIHPDKKLHITAEPTKKRFMIREKASIKIKVTDDAGSPVRTNLGVSVYDQSYNNLADPVNMLSYCYLSSQIRGKIHNPNYYFDEKNKDRAEAMELLLLTQGWRRYVWNSANSDYKGKSFLADEIHGLQTIKSKKKAHQNQTTNQLIQVSGPEGNSQFTWVDSTGLFTVDHDMMKALRGGYVYLKPMLSEEFKPELSFKELFPLIDTIRSRKSNTYPFIDLQGYKKEITFIQPIISQDSTTLLDEIVVTKKGRKPFRDKFLGSLNSLAQKNLGPWVCSHGWLENYKEGYTHHHDPRYCPHPHDAGEKTAPIIGKRYHIMKAEYYSCNASGGWCFKPLDLQWVTYQGAIYTEEELLRMNNLWRTKGYYAAREFYQPDEVDMQLSIPDARNTLLWQPSVITDEKGEATVSFYCSDINTGFIGLVEGVDGAGLLGTTKCEFRVMR